MIHNAVLVTGLMMPTMTGHCSCGAHTVARTYAGDAERDLTEACPAAVIRRYVRGSFPELEAAFRELGEDAAAARIHQVRKGSAGVG